MGRSTSVPGAETSVLDLVHLLELVTSHDTMRVGEVRRSCLDPTAAFEQLAWRSSTPLAQGLRSTLDWAHGCRPAARAGFSTA